MPGKFYDLLKNRYLKLRRSIKCANKRRDYFDYQNSVRQGCILSLMHVVQFVLKGEKTQILPHYLTAQLYTVYYMRTIWL